MEIPNINPIVVLIGPAVIDWALTVLWSRVYWASCIPVTTESRPLLTWDFARGPDVWPEEIVAGEKQRFLVRPVSPNRALFREPYRGKGAVSGTLFVIGEFIADPVSHRLYQRIRLRWFPVLIYGLLLYLALPKGSYVILLIFTAIFILFGYLHYRQLRKAIDALVPPDGTLPAA